MQLTPRYLVDNKTTVIANDAGFITEYRTVYQRHIKIYKGIDNVLQFKVLNHDQKPVLLTSYTPKLVVFDQNKLALYFSRAPIPYARDYFPNNWPSDFPASNNYKAFRHIGLYAYKCKFLRDYPKLCELGSKDSDLDLDSDLEPKSELNLDVSLDSGSESNPELDSGSESKLELDSSSNLNLDSELNSSLDLDLASSESLEQLKIMSLGYRIHVDLNAKISPAGVDTEADLRRVGKMY